MSDNSLLTINSWLISAASRLTKAGIGTAELDALVLLEDCLNKDRAYLLAHSDTKLTLPQGKKLETQLRKRVQHEPLAYIRGKTEFYGREFIITPAVLEPRPETETMIELFRSLQLEKPAVVDVGTGCGAIAITAKLEYPATTLTAVDIDPRCLKVTIQNSKKYSVDIEVLQGNLITPLTDRPVDVILANLPYVPNDFGINKAALHEPRIAIFGGSDGLSLYRKLFIQIKNRKQQPAYILTEALPFQHRDLAVLAHRHGYNLYQTNDFIQLFKLS